MDSTCAPEAPEGVLSAPSCAQMPNLTMKLAGGCAGGASRGVQPGSPALSNGTSTGSPGRPLWLPPPQQ
eukprot:10999445-Alexandrium_andersonii.AAC.1